MRPSVVRMRKFLFSKDDRYSRDSSLSMASGYDGRARVVIWVGHSGGLM